MCDSLLIFFMTILLHIETSQLIALQISRLVSTWGKHYQKKDKNTIWHLSRLMPVVDRDRCWALFGSRIQPCILDLHSDTAHLLPLDLGQSYLCPPHSSSEIKKSENTSEGCCISKRIGEMLPLGHTGKKAHNSQTCWWQRVVRQIAEGKFSLDTRGYVLLEDC